MMFYYCFFSIVVVGEQICFTYALYQGEPSLILGMLPMYKDIKRGLAHRLIVLIHVKKVVFSDAEQSQI